MQEAKGYFLQAEEQGAGIPFNGELRHSNTSAKTKIETGTDVGKLSQNYGRFQKP